MHIPFILTFRSPKDALHLPWDGNKEMFQISLLTMYLHILQSAWVSSELGKVLADVHGADLLHQQVRFVEKQDDGDIQEELVVDDGLKDVHALHQAVRPAVLHQKLEPNTLSTLALVCLVNKSYQKSN